VQNVTTLVSVTAQLQLERQISTGDSSSPISGQEHRLGGLVKI